MMFRSFRRTDQAGTIGALYGAIVAQARHPTFYRCYQVPDTIDGRFDMIVLHVALFSRRIRAESGAIRALGQAVSDFLAGALAFPGPDTIVSGQNERSGMLSD